MGLFDDKKNKLTHPRVQPYIGGGGLLATASSSSATPGGSNTQLQYNNNSTFGGITGATSDGTSLRVGLDNLLLGAASGAGGSILDGDGYRLVAFGGSGGSPKVNYFTLSNTATGGTPTITMTSAVDSNVGLTITTKGTGLFLVTGGAARFQTTLRTSGAQMFFRVITPADTGLTASQEVPGISLGGSTANPPVTITRQWATGALTTQREVVVTHPTYAFVGASTITNAATFAITAAPIAGTNATITNAYALWVQADKSRFDGRVIINSPDSAIADADLPASSLSFYLNEGGNTMVVKVKYAGGTVKTGTVALT